jgi:hypothetical protein
MKRFTAPLAIATLGYLGLASAAHAISLSAVPSESTVAGIGTDVTVALIVDGLAPGFDPSLAGYDITLLFDDTIIQYASTAFGDPVLGGSWLDLDSTGSVTQATTPTSDSVNVLELSFALPFPTDPFTAQPGSFTLAEITFTTVGLGASEINFGTVVLSDPFAQSLDGTLFATAITVTAIPIPAALLFPSALLALVAWRRR